MDYTREYLQDAFKRSETDPGVDRDRYFNEILYDVESDSTHTAESLSQLTDLVEEIRTNKGIKRINLCDLDLYAGGGVYALSFDDLEGFVFEGASITVRDFTSGIAFRNCRDIYLRNINFTYDVPMCASGIVIGSTKRSVTVKLYSDYKTDVFLQDKNNPQKIYNSLFEKELIAEYLEYEAGTNIPRENGNFKYNNYNEGNVGPKLAIVGHTVLDPQTVRVDFADAITRPPVGTTVSMAFTMYQCPGILFEECEDVYLENIEINQVPGMAINFTTCRNVNINRIMIRSNVEEHQFLTLTADGLHIKNCMGKVAITNSLLEGSHDDALNIAGMYLEVFSVHDGKACVRAHLGMWATHVPLAGDVLEVRDGSTMALKEEVTLLSVEKKTECVVITFDRDSSIDEGDFLANLNNVASLEFVNNVVRNKRNRGLLLQTRDVLVRDNYFSNVIHGAILIVCEVYNFCESISAKNHLIAHNKFYRCNEFTNADIEITAMIDEQRIPEPPLMEHITIRSNLFAESGNCAVYVNSGRDIRIENNVMFRPGRTPLSETNKNAVAVLNSRDVLLIGNRYALRDGTEKVTIQNSTVTKE